MFINVIKLFTRRKLVFFIALFAIVMLAVPMAKSRVKPYYSGEAINYNNQIYIGTTNTGKFELFGFDNEKIYRKSSIMTQDNTSFSDLLFRQEGGRLYVYLVNGELYKYDITDPYFPALITKIKDNSDSKIFGVIKAGEKIATLGSAGVKIWNNNLQIINSYNIKVNGVDNLIFSESGGFIYHYEGDNLTIIDANTRDIIIDTQLNITQENHNQKPYNDNLDGSVYVVDDNSLRKIYLNGHQDKFSHISNVGYDVATLKNKDYVYFSDGHGVVKVDKENMKAISWVYTNNKGPIGGWAMGIDVVENKNGEDVVVVFNGSSILAMNKNLALVDYYAARDQDLSPTEPLFLSADKYRAAPNSDVSLRGGGFGPHENLAITFSGNINNVKADELGRFVKIIKVPSVFPRNTDIKVDGERTGLTYSISFEIE